MAKALKMASVGPVMVTIRSGQFPSEMLILAPLWKEKTSSGIATAKQPFEALSLGQVLSQASPSSSSVPASQHLTLKFSTPVPCHASSTALPSERVSEHLLWIFYCNANPHNQGKTVSWGHCLGQESGAYWSANRWGAESIRTLDKLKLLARVLISVFH